MKLASKLIILNLCLINLMLDASSAMARAEEDNSCSGMNHPAYQEEYRACLRISIAKKAKEAGVDCVDCIFEQEKNNSNGFVQALGVLAQPLAYLASSYTVAKYENKTQEKWAQAYASGFEQCTNRFNSFLNYNTTVGANPISATDTNSFSNACNNNGYGSYAGYGGLTGNFYGGYGNPFLANGYSSGFMSAYGGPYATGTGAIYNTGMMSGSVGVSGYLGTSTSSEVYQTGVTPAFGF